MLDFASESRLTCDSAPGLIFDVQLPPELEDNFDRTGQVPSLPDDGRQFPRLYLRGKQHCAAIEYKQTLPCVPRRPGWHKVYTVDISKGGIAILHSEQLFPGERMQVLFTTGDRMMIEVKWCRRVAEKCFWAGTRFLGKGTDNS